MTLLRKMFGGAKKASKAEEKALPWKQLDNLELLETIEEESSTRPQLIFKHSTTCGISGMVLRMITNSWQVEEGLADLHFLDLHAYREVSNEVAIKFQVIHQSPQLLVIKNGQTTFHASHGAITDVDLNTLL